MVHLGPPTVLWPFLILGPNRCDFSPASVNIEIAANAKTWRQIWRVVGGESGSPELLGSPRTSPEVPQTSPEVFGDFPGSSVTVELNSNPEVPRKFPKLPRKFPKLPRGQPLSLGSLTPSPDSQKLPLKNIATLGWCTRTSCKDTIRTDVITNASLRELTLQFLLCFVLASESFRHCFVTLSKQPQHIQDFQSQFW